MTVGNMQYGIKNDSGLDQTELSANAPNWTFRVVSASPGADAIHANSIAGGGGNAVNAFSGSRNGVRGSSGSQTNSGVYGENNSRGGFGIAGRSNAPPPPFQLPFNPPGAAVYGDNTRGGCAGLFNGSVIVSGGLTKPGGGFVIDSPVDPANRVLYHSFVESPDMMNVYNGNATTDGDGNAIVELPSYFEALNRDFRYQLTVVGGEFAQAIVAEEVRDNHFAIRTDRPNVTVSWQVTGIRQDAWANVHRPEVDVEKPEDARGTYLTPEEHGEPVTSGIFYVEPPAPEDLQIRDELGQQEE